MTERGRILVVDDEPAITDFIALGLHHEGYEVATGATGTRGSVPSTGSSRTW